MPKLEGKPVRPEQGLLGLRKELGVYANLRPAQADGIDLVIVRELVGGLYFGEKGTRDDGTWFDTCEYSRPEVERIARQDMRYPRHDPGVELRVGEPSVQRRRAVVEDPLRWPGPVDRRGGLPPEGLGILHAAVVRLPVCAHAPS